MSELYRGDFHTDNTTITRVNGNENISENNGLNPKVDSYKMRIYQALAGGIVGLLMLTGCSENTSGEADYDKSVCSGLEGIDKEACEEWPIPYENMATARANELRLTVEAERSAELEADSDIIEEDNIGLGIDSGLKGPDAYNVIRPDCGGVLSGDSVYWALSRAMGGADPYDQVGTNIGRYVLVYNPETGEVRFYGTMEDILDPDKTPTIYPDDEVCVSASGEALDQLISE